MLGSPARSVARPHSGEGGYSNLGHPAVYVEEIEGGKDVEDGKGVAGRRTRRCGGIHHEAVSLIRDQIINHTDLILLIIYPPCFCHHSSFDQCDRVAEDLNGKNMEGEKYGNMRSPMRIRELRGVRENKGVRNHVTTCE